MSGWEQMSSLHLQRRGGRRVRGEEGKRERERKKEKEEIKFNVNIKRILEYVVG